MQDRSRNIFTALQIVAVISVLWILFSRPDPWDLQRSMGAALVVMGLVGIAAARYQLGRSFSLKPEAHQLVTRGVYSKIRNPIYVFGMVELAGLVLMVRRPVLWLFLPVVVAVQVLRARREAQVLEATFGDAYREYRRNTWF